MAVETFVQLNGDLKQFMTDTIWIFNLKKMSVKRNMPKWMWIYFFYLKFIYFFIGFASAGSSSSSNSDGTGHTFTGTNNDGLGTYTHTQNKPGSVSQTGGFPGNNPQGPYYGPANFGQQPGFGVNYSPGKSNQLMSFHWIFTKFTKFLCFY